MASAGRWDRQFMVTLYTLVALAGLVLGGWVTLGRFAIPLGTYCIVAIIALAYGFSTSWFGAGYRGVALGGFVGIFVVLWYLSAAQGDFGELQYAWILSALAGSVLARKEFPWRARRSAPKRSVGRG